MNILPRVKLTVSIFLGHERIDMFPIIFDVKGLRPDMLRFSRFFIMHLCINYMTSESKRQLHNDNLRKT